MSRRVRVGILIAIIGIGLAAAGIYVLSNMLRQSLAPLPAPTPIPPITEQVVVTTHGVALGTVLNAGDLKVVEVPVELAPPGALNVIDMASGRFTKIDLSAGEVILDHHLADPTNVTHDVAFILDDNQVLLAFPAADLMSALSIIQRGDLVDLFITLQQEVRIVREGPEGVLIAGEEEETETIFLTFDAMQRIEITALVADIVYEEQQQQPTVQIGEGEPQPQPTPKPAEIHVKAYLLALSPQDALVLKHLKDIGATFDFVLRSPTSTEIFELSPVNSDYLIDRYELELPK